MNQEYKHNFLHAGKLAKEALLFGKAKICRGASYQQVLKEVREKIFSLGAIPAFPPQMALNDTAAHFLLEPSQDTILTDQIVKLDVGVCYKGAIGDCATTVDLSGRFGSLIQAAEEALSAAEKILAVGLPVREIGKVIEKTILSHGFVPIKNLCGHGLGYYKIHTNPNIPNYEDESRAVLKPGMTFAIEPFATNGIGYIYEEDNPTIFSWQGACPRSITIPEALLSSFDSYQGLPFALSDLMQPGLPLKELKIQLNRLIEAGALIGYGPLMEEGKGMVAQAESSVLIDEDGKIFISTHL